jgi:hypothetical protein
MSSQVTDDQEVAPSTALPPPAGPDQAAWLATAASLGHRLTDPIDRALERVGLRIEGLSILPRDRPPAQDGPAHLLVHAASGPVAVLACSRAGDDDHVRIEVERAEAAADALGPDLGRVIVRPVVSMERGGATWAVYPLCLPLERRSGLRWLQRLQLRGPLLRWLARVTSFTGGPLHGKARAEVERTFSESLEWVAGERWFSPEVHARARRALGRLHSGLWSPRRVLSHGDLWLGNVMLPPAAPWPAPRDGWPPFVLIDWGGADTQGFAFYDLLRLADSLRLAPAALRFDVQRHARLLDCHPEDAFGYLLASLGHLGVRLGYFERSRYASMSERLVASLADLGLG